MARPRRRAKQRIRFIRVQTVASLTASANQRHTLFAPSDPHGPLTIVRMQANLWFQKSAANVTSQAYQFGFIVEPSAAGPGQNSVPSTEPHAQWMWLEEDHLLATDEDGTAGVGTMRYRLDIRAKRRMKTDQNLYMIVENGAGTTINYALGLVITIVR